jgi:hypothetical protein
MSEQVKTKKQAITPAAPQPVKVERPAITVSERESERPDLATQIENASRLGHSLGTFQVSSVPAEIQAMPLIQRQENPEKEEDEDEEALQMQREPAAIQLQETPEEEEDEEEPLQKQPDRSRVGLEGGPVPADVESAIGQARGGGQALDPAVQAQLGEALGHNFNSVRVHTDAQADALNQQLSAKAFTTGRDIFFRQGAYDPASSAGRELLAHELSHVVQQSSGRINVSGCGMVARPVGDAYEQEADRDAEEVTRSENTSVFRKSVNDHEEIQRNSDTGEFQERMISNQTQGRTGIDFFSIKGILQRDALDDIYKEFNQDEEKRKKIDDATNESEIPEDVVNKIKNAVLDYAFSLLPGSIQKSKHSSVTKKNFQIFFSDKANFWAGTPGMLVIPDKYTMANLILIGKSLEEIRACIEHELGHGTFLYQYLFSEEETGPADLLAHMEMLAILAEVELPEGWTPAQAHLEEYKKEVWADLTGYYLRARKKNWEWEEPETRYAHLRGETPTKDHPSGEKRIENMVKLKERLSKQGLNKKG